MQFIINMYMKIRIYCYNNHICVAHWSNYKKPRTQTGMHKHTRSGMEIPKFSSVQDGIYVLGKSLYVLHPVSQKFPQRCFWNGSNVRLIDDGPLLSFQGRSSNASSLNASLLQEIDSVMSLALCPQVVSQASQHFRSSEKQTICEDDL